MSITVRRAIDARVDGASSVNVHHDFATGASSSTWQSFDATSKSSSSLEFNILVPGQNAYWNRQVYIETSTVFKFDVLNQSNALGASFPPTMRIGRDIATCGFPLNSLLQTVTTSINGSTITTQQNQIMPLVRRLIGANEKNRKLMPCPSGVGQFADNSDAGYTESNEIVAMGRTFDRPAPNSAFRVMEFGNYSGTTFTPYASDGTTDPSWVGTGAGKYCRITTREPLLAAPFITTNDEPAFTNVQAANIRCTLLAPSDVRLLRTNRSFGMGQFTTKATLDDYTAWVNLSSNLAAGCGVANLAYASSSPFDTARVWCNFLSPSPDQLVPASTIYPYLQFDPLQTAILPNPAPQSILTVFREDVNTTSNITAISQTVILNTCPDMLAIYAVLGDPAGLANTSLEIANPGTFSGREDMFATIDNLSIMWNNQPAILATARTQDLWRMSYDNGLRYSYDVYAGAKMGERVHKVDTGATAYYGGTAVDGLYPSTGAPLLLAINKDFPTEPGTAPGVAGVFSLSVTAQCHYYGMPTMTSGLISQGTGVVANGSIAVARPLTLFVVPVRSQYLQLNAGGTSSIVSAISSGEAMLDAPFTSDRVIGATPGMVGGWGFNMASLGNLASRGANLWKRGKEVAEKAKRGYDIYKQHEDQIKGAISTGKAALEQFKGGEPMEEEGAGVIGHGVHGYGVRAYGVQGHGKRSRYETSAYSRMS